MLFLFPGFCNAIEIVAVDNSPLDSVFSRVVYFLTVLQVLFSQTYFHEKKKTKLPGLNTQST